ncbi:hypothetical protein MMC13_000457 [Lambiella insularis]|nr:hypothetical protein [Lambiella insularis]
MPENALPIINGHSIVDQVQILHDRQHFSRSPHPYHRLGVKISTFSESGPTEKSIQKGQNKTDYFGADSRKRRKLSTSPSESGTEADDERPPFLKGLPAPPSRPRRGLKDANSPLSSSYLTPSYLDEESRRVPLGTRASQCGSPEEQARANEEVKRIQKKKTQRRHAELARRALEVSLLAGVGFACFSSAEVDLRAGILSTASYMNTANDLSELLIHSSLVIGIYLLYLLRLLWRQGRKVYSQHLKISTLRIQVSYDPAPLLYPVFLPLLVACSLASAHPQLVLSNIVLCICCIPVHMIPLYEYGGSGSLLWLICVLPVTFLSARNTRISDYPLNILYETVDTETLALFFPLHRTLLPTLKFLTTTSLLPAELQLFSVALINLLIFASSPQAQILKALLWLGGITMFVLCRHVLRWTVELARVPSWRFRRPRHAIRKRNVFVRAIYDTVGGALRNLYLSRAHPDSSDSDDYQAFPLSTKLQTSQRQKASSSVLSRPTLMAESVAGVSTIDDIVQIPSIHMDGAINSMVAEQFRKRRNTLPNDLTARLNTQALRASLAQIRSNPLPTRPKSFLSLTNAQATILKWIYAGYVYLVALVIILVPIRQYVSIWSLNGNEPIGWALGYLLGDLPVVRLQSIMWSLDSWICLPNRDANEGAQICRGEQLRRNVLGPANTRLLICVYCLASIVVGLIMVFRLSSLVEVNTRRKVFHGMMVVMFLPTMFLDPAFIGLAFALILAIFLLLDLFRASQLPPISKPLTYFLAPYVDGRDHRGPIIVSPIFLLIGCAIPLWLSLAATKRSGAAFFEGWDVQTRELGMITGIVCVGMGDAAASLIGRRYGRRRWPWSGGKSLEGSSAFAAAVVLGIVTARSWLIIGGWVGDSGDTWMVTIGKSSLAAGLSALSEALLSGMNDNVLVPVILWLLVRGLQI